LFNLDHNKIINEVTGRDMGLASVYNHC